MPIPDGSAPVDATSPALTGTVTKQYHASESALYCSSWHFRFVFC